MSRVFDFIRQAQEAPGTPSQKLVHLSLAIAANHAGVCWPGQDVLMAQTGLSERGVRDAIRWLEEQGYLETRPDYVTHVKYGNRRVNNIYTLVDPSRRTAPNTTEPNRQSVPVGQPAVSAAANRQSVPVQGTTSDTTSELDTGTRFARTPRKARRKDNTPVVVPQGNTRQLFVDEGMEAPPEPEPVARPKPKPKPKPKDDNPAPRAMPGPDTMGGLVYFWRNHLLANGHFGRGFSQGTVQITKVFRELRHNGATPEEIREMVRLYAVDESMHTDGTQPWQNFSYQATRLHNKARERVAVRSATTTESYTESGPSPVYREEDYA